MPRVALYNTNGEAVGEVELSDAVFGAEINEALMHQAIVAYRANQRVGTADTRTRGEVSGGGRKPWRQKGTGRARQGSIRSPLWRKGGTVFGPHPRDYELDFPRKARRAALRSALSAKVQSGAIKVLDTLAFEEPKTQQMAAVLANLKAAGSSLVVTPGPDQNVYKSARNIEGVCALSAKDLNLYEVLTHDNLIITRDAVSVVEEVLGNHA